MSGSAPIDKNAGSIGILYICAAINILVAVILLLVGGRSYGAVNSLAMGLIFLGWARHASKFKEIVDLLGGHDAEAMMKHAQRLEAETEALQKKTGEVLAKYEALLKRVEDYEARLEEDLRVERTIRKAVEAERDELRKRLENSATIGFN